MIIVFTGVYYEPPTLFSGLYEFPAWAEGIGWAIVAFCLVPLPLVFLYVMCKEGAYKIIYRSSQPNSLWHPAADKNRTGRYERVRRHKKEKDVDPDKIDMNSNTWKESGHTDLQTTQPHSIYATVSNENGIHAVEENNSIHGRSEHKGVHAHVGTENKGFDHDGDRHSSDDEKRSTDCSHTSVKHTSDVHRSRSPSPVSHGGHFDTAAF